MWIKIIKDWNWYLAEIEWYKNIYAYWESKKEAVKELIWVLEMMIDYHTELLKSEQKLKKLILKSKDYSYAI